MSMRLKPGKELWEKLCLSNQPAVASRAASSILFKLNHNLYFKSNDSAEDIINLTTGLHKALFGLIKKRDDLDDLVEFTEFPLLLSVLSIIDVVCINPISHYAKENFTSILGVLYSMTTMDLFKKDNSYQLLQQVIVKLSSLKRQYSHPFVDEVLSEFYEEPAFPTTPQQTHITTMNASDRGAGVVLNFEEVQQGWNLPEFVLSREDEAFFYDLMVCFSMHPDKAGKMMWDALIDFPAEVLVSQTGLLRSLLDVVGSSFTQCDIAADSEGLHPITAMKWLTKLLQKAATSYQTLLTGSLCCVQPTWEDVGEEGNDREKNIDLTFRLAEAMHSMRYPLLRSKRKNDLQGAADDRHQKELLDRERGGATLCPVPSLAGLAFACCAASLPLLRGKNAVAASSVLVLVRTALPLVVEADICQGKEGLDRGTTARLAHLLGRVEELIDFRSSGSDLFDFVATADLSDAEKQDAKAQERRAEQACVLSFLSVVIEVMAVIPPPLFSSQLTIGRLTKQLMCIMLISQSLLGILPNYGDIFVAILREHDPVVLAEIQRAEKLISSSNVFSVHSTDFIGAARDNCEATLILLQHVEVATALLEELDTSSEVVSKEAKATIAECVPLVLVAAVQAVHAPCPRNDAGDCLVGRAVAVVLRMLSSSGCEELRIVALTHLLRWVTEPRKMISRVDGFGSMTSTGDQLDDFVLSPVTVRHAQRLEIDPANARHVLVSIATPLFARTTMLVYFSEQLGHGEDSAQCRPGLLEAAAAVLEAVCSFLVANLVADVQAAPTVLAEWAGLLPLLKLMEWESALGATAAKSYGTVSAVMRFSHALEVFCLSSSQDSFMSVYIQTLILGFSHRSTLVRTECASKLVAELFRSEGVSEDQVSVLRCGHDPFGESSEFQLEEWALAPPADAGTRKVSEGIFTHVALQKVYRIAAVCGEARSQATALNQMVDMMASEQHLLATCSTDWLLEVARNAVCTLESQFVVVQAGELVSAAERKKLFAERNSAVHPVEFSDQCQVLISVARLLNFLVSSAACLKSHWTFCPSARCRDNQISLWAPLQCFLRVCLFRRSTKIAAQMQFDALLRAGALCGQAVQVVSVHAAAWGSLVCPTEELPRWEFVPSSSHGSGRCEPYLACDIVPLPTFLAERLLQLRPKCEANSFCLVIHRTISAVGHSDIPDMCILSATAKAWCAEDKEKLHHDTAVHLFEMITHANDHLSVREAITTATCVATANPLLYFTSVYLKLTPLLSVSHFFLSQPQDLQEHATLALCLQFLVSSFQELQSRLHIGCVVDALNEASEFVLVHMAQYLRDNGTSQQFVRRFRSLDEENVHRDMIRTVILSYTQLLQVLSACSHPHLRLSTLLVDGAVLSHFVKNVLFDEDSDKRTRAAALSTMENLFLNHDGFFLVQSMTGGQLSEPHNGGFLEELCRSARLLRMPNSMRGHQSVLAVLRLLRFVLDHNLLFGSGAASASLRTPHSLQWVKRLLYDRRSEVKVLALQILKLSVDALDRSEEAISTVAFQGLMEDVEDLSCLDALHMILRDSSESRLVRALACQMLVDLILQRSAASEHTRQGVNLLVVLTAAADCLALSGDAVCVTSIDLIVRALVKLFVKAGQDAAFCEDFLPLVRSLRLLPALISLLQEQVVGVLAEKALVRVSAGWSGVSAARDTTSRIRFASTGWESEDVRARNTYGDIQRSNHEMMVVLLVQTQGNVCTILQLLFTPNFDVLALIDDCTRHSRLVPFLLSNLHSRFQSGVSHVLMMQRYTALADLLYSIIERDNNCRESTSCSASSALSRGGCVTDVLKQMGVFLQQDTADGSSLLKGCSAANAANFFESMLRLLGAILVDESWRCMAGLCAPSRDHSSSPLSENLFRLILDFRDEVARALSTSSAFSVLLGTVDVVASLFLQHTHRSRVILAMEEAATETSLLGASLGVVSKAAEFLLSVPSSGNTGAALSEKSGSCDHSSATSAVGKSRAVIRRGGVRSDNSQLLRTSTSTVCSKSASASSSRWRDRSRGYHWRETSEGSTRGGEPPRCSDIDFPRSLKVQLFNALLVLIHALPDCPQAVDIASQHRVVYHLTVLLRYAARHSVRGNGLNNSSAQVSQHIPPRSGVLPSSGQISAAIYALCCSFTLDCGSHKQEFANSGESHAAVVGSSGGGNTLHHLVSHGLHKETHSPVRWLSLSLVAALSSHTSQIGSTPTLRGTLAVRVATALQRSAYNIQADHPESMAHLVNCLAALISVDCQSGGHQVFYNSNSLVASAAKLNGPEFRLVPFTELIMWVHERCGSRVEVTRALCRSIGMVSSRDCADSKKVVSMINASLVSFLCESCVSHVNEAAVGTVAAVSLWAVLSRSEKAKVAAREVLQRLPELVNAEAAVCSPDSDVGARARIHIRSLLLQ